MNSQLEEFAKRTLKESLSRCTDGQVLMFKRMYSHNDLDKEITAVVDDMPADRLDWAMEQVQATIRKNEANHAINSAN